MAFSPGYVATLSIGGTDISAFLKDVKFHPARKAYELAVLGGGTVRRMVGPVATEIDIDGWFDPTVATVFTTHMAEATPTTTAFVHHPQGSTGPTYSGNAFVVDFHPNTPSEGPATFTAKLVVDGTVTYA